MTQPDKLADDLLTGVAEISMYTGLPERRVYYLIAQGAIPTRKLGHRSIIAFRSEIDAALRKQGDVDAS
jgi:predicted DNA-binding transcriptional regulator AlpA